MSTAWSVLGGVVAVAVIVGAMWAVSASAGAVGRISAVITLVKIMLSSLQILNQLDFTLDLEWPGLFKQLMTHFVRLFSFDLMSMLDLGCVTGYSFYSKWALTFSLIPGLLLIVYGVAKLRGPEAHAR